MIIRRANDADVEEIWSVRTAAIKSISHKFYGKNDLNIWASTSQPENFDKVIQELQWMIVIEEHKVVGTGFLDIKNHEIGGMFVDPNFQNRGIGKKILRALEKIAVENGIQQLNLDATLSAVGFYEANGFNIISKSKCHHVSGLQLNCCKMSKDLENSE